MLFIPNDVTSKLELDKVLALLRGYCVTVIAQDQLKEASFIKNVQEIDVALSQIVELGELVDNRGDIPLIAFEDVRYSLELLSKQNYVLEAEHLLEIRKVVSSFGALYGVVNGGEENPYVHLREEFRDVYFEKKIVKMISDILDDEGVVKSNASPELARIYNQISSKEREVHRVFNDIIGTYKEKGWLSDTQEGVKNGRRVLAIPAEFKRKISGVIHDESSTGKTSFVEPQEVVVINNLLIELEVDKRKEVYKILLALCNELRPYGRDIAKYQGILVRFDIIRSKHILAKKMNAQKPKLIDKPRIQLYKAYHPLLLLKNNKMEIATIPFDMNLIPPNRMLLISGPNAGGKSITMKAVGLIQLMTQIGCLVPVDSRSVLGVFENLFCDIGDQQSIEDDLSTYSSRLKNMKAFLEKANAKTMVLIDEFGSGTDPKAGGAIAEALLFQLVRKKVYGVITTHYSNLKLFAYKMKGLLNGAMHFDEAELHPTYELQLGKPGSSFAFEIATQAGLNQDVLNYARKRAGKHNQAVDKLLVDLQNEKKEIENKLEKLIGKEEKLDQLIKNYEGMAFEFEVKRKRLKLEKKQFEVQETSNDRKELEKLLRELKTENNEEKIKQRLLEKKNQNTQSKKDLIELNDEARTHIDFDVSTLKVGDMVQIRSNGMKGEVVRIDKNKVEIAHGIMNVNVDILNIQPIKEYLEINTKKAIQYKLSTQKGNFDSELDLRGYRHSEALEFIQEFLDQALLNNADMLKIVHGKGSGTIKQLVWKKAKEYADIKKIWHPEDNFGGEGITFIRF